MKLNLIAPNNVDKAFWVEWYHKKIKFSISIEPGDEESGWYYLDFTDESNRVYEIGVIDEETLRTLYDVLKMKFK